jgi:dolichol-phosphate mannosyltransferase
MIKLVRGDYDMAVGSRIGVEGWSIKRKVISAGGKLLAKLALGVSLSDPMSGYFVVDKKVFERVESKLDPIGFKIMLEVYYRALPLKVVEVPYVFVDRVAGESKVMNNITDYLRQLRSLRSSFK